jgi:hypothetical protein
MMNSIQASANRLRLHDPWDPSGRVEDLISHLEDVQELAADANQPIPDSHLVGAAFTNMFYCGLYDGECKAWEVRPADELTWPNFKTHFLEAQATLHRRRSRSTSKIAALVGQLVAYNENYITTSRQECTSFVANNQKKILQELQNMKTELAAIKFAPAKPQRVFEKHDGYCWTHGFKVSKLHNSSTCKNTRPGHKQEATKDNMLGGSTRKAD